MVETNLVYGTGSLPKPRKFRKDDGYRVRIQSKAQVDLHENIVLMQK